MIPAGILIIVALVLYAIFYFTHGRYLQNKVAKADPKRPTPAHQLYDGVDYVPANKYVLYGHHFASIAGAGPIVGPALALAWGWLPSIIWVWFGNVFVGVVHDYLSLMASVRYDGRSIGWVAGELMGKKAKYIFNAYIWFALLLVVAAFGNVIASLFEATPGAGLAALLLLFFAVVTGFLMYKTPLGFKGATVIAWIFIIIAIYAGTYAGGILSGLTYTHWIIILLVYIIIAASIPVWVLLQPRDYINAYILWASLAIGGGSLIALLLRGAGIALFPATTSFTANVVGAQPSPFWPAVPLVIACGALSGFHSLVGSGTTSKQLDNELHGLLVAYAGMETEGFLSSMVIGCMIAFGVLALTDLAYASISGGNTAFIDTFNKVAQALHMKPVTPENVTKDYVNQVITEMTKHPDVFGQYYIKMSPKKLIAGSYAYATNAGLGLPVDVMKIFATLWITGFALTSLDTATRLGRYAWQELMEPLKKRALGAYKVLANKWVASIILAVIGIALAYYGALSLLWPAFAGMNQLLSSLALMTVAVWASKVQKASGLGKALVVAPAVFMWITVTLALLWYEVAIIPVYLMAGKYITAGTVGTITAIGIFLNLLIFALWIRRMLRK